MLATSPVTVRYRKSRYCHVMYRLLYPSIRVRTAPPVSVRVSTRISVSFSFTVLSSACVPRTFAIADLNLPSSTPLPSSPSFLLSDKDHLHCITKSNKKLIRR